jgi:flavodoxin
MRPIVVYYSKTGNTKAVAELIAVGLECEAYPINLMEKRGAGTKNERDVEKKLYDDALQRSVNCSLAVIGTPTGFQMAKSMIKRYVGDVKAQRVALFCTYDNKVGATLMELEDMLRERGVEVVCTLSLGKLKPGGFSGLEETVRSEYLGRIYEFIELCEVGLERVLPERTA